MHYQSTPHKPRVADSRDGSITVNFGGTYIYPMRSCLNPDLPATTLYITDIRDQLDPDLHPIHGSKASPRVYKAWFYRKEDDKCSQEGEVAVKWVKGMTRIRMLERERENYCRLSELQGTVIPRLLDYMEASIEGVDVACLVIEWCGEPHPENPKLFSAQKLQQGTILHKEGWTHGNLLDAESHHFVVTDEDETGNPVRIIDLTEAFEHHCFFSEPCGSVKRDPDCCYELDALAAMRLINL